MFGLNPFREPNFKVVWGQSEFHKMGNVWRDIYGNERRGYRMRYLCDGGPSWNLMRWKPASFYGTPALWYMNTWDPHSRVYALGEYPWKGRYEVLYSFCKREVVEGKMTVMQFPLTHLLIDRIIPTVLAVQRMTPAERRAAAALVREKKEKAENEEITDRMMDELPAWYGPVSFSRQGIRTSLLDRKMYQIQQAWNRLSRGGKTLRFEKGFFQGKSPIIRPSGRLN